MALWNEIASRIRPLGFGALFGSGVLGLIYILFPFVFPPSISINIALTVGSLLGAGFHKMIGRLFDVIFGGSIAKHTEYFLKLVKLYSVRKVLGAERFQAAVGILAITEALDGRVSQSLIEEMQSSVAHRLPANVGSTVEGGEVIHLSELMKFMQTYGEFQRKLTVTESMKAGQQDANLNPPTPH